MPGVGEQELQFMGAGLQRNLGFCLTGAKVQVIFIVRYGTVEIGHFRINEEMVMPCVFLFKSSWGDAHPREPELDHKFLLYAAPI